VACDRAERQAIDDRKIIITGAGSGIGQASRQALRGAVVSHQRRALGEQSDRGALDKMPGGYHLGLSANQAPLLHGTDYAAPSARTPEAHRTITELGSRGAPSISRCDGGRRPFSSVMP
jgi:hypothetical protein